MINDKLKNISNEIIASSLPTNMYGNPLIILMIIGILVNAIRVIQECNKTDSKNVEETTKLVRSLCNRRGWFTKMRLKKIMRQNMNKEDYKQYSNNLSNAILTKGESIKDEDILILLEAANV